MTQRASPRNLSRSSIPVSKAMVLDASEISHPKSNPGGTLVKGNVYGKVGMRYYYDANLNRRSLKFEGPLAQLSALAKRLQIVKRTPSVGVHSGWKVIQIVSLIDVPKAAHNT
jgi:hypothetical protein